MIDNNIANALGAGSGIDSAGLIKQLTELERMGPQQRIDSRREKAEAQISGFGAMTSAIDTLRGSIKALSDKEGLHSKTAAFSSSENISPTKLDTNVQPGSYSFEVDALAQAQSITFGGAAKESEAVGTGELTFNFGSWTRTDGVATEFTQNPDAESFSITIDNSNNSLRGIRDAINAADKGVQASIVNDGTNFRLVISAPSGATNELQITADEGGDPLNNVDGTGLSKFAFNTGVTDFATLEKQRGADAELTVNGLAVTRQSNTVTDLIEGLSLDLLKAEPGKLTTITVTEDKAFAEENIRAFVESYNTFLEEMQPLTGYDEEEEAFGPLRNDPLAKSVISRFRSLISDAIPGLADTSFTNLANVGIRTELDGTLSIDEETFSDAMDNHYADVQKLFSSHTQSSSSDVTVNSFGPQTKAGTYEIDITTPPARGFFEGVGAGAALAGFNTGSTDYSFSVAVNGVSSGALQLPADTVYDTPEDLAGALQAAINSDAALAAQGATVNVSFDTDNNRFVMTSNRHGAASNVAIETASAGFSADLGLTVGTGTAGIDVKGTVNGVEGFGLGNVLLPKLGEPGAGLSMIIGENATTSTVNVSRGFAGGFDEQIQQFLQNNGLIDSREKELDRQLGDMDVKEEQLERRMTIYQERLMRQFIAMERVLASLNSQGGFLEGLVDRLPFTAKND